VSTITSPSTPTYKALIRLDVRFFVHQDRFANHAVALAVHTQHVVDGVPEPMSLQSNRAFTTATLCAFSITAKSMEMSGNCSKPTASMSTMRDPLCVRCALDFQAASPCSRSAGWCSRSAAMKTPAEKQNIPEFQRKLPLATYFSASSRNGFSTNCRERKAFGWGSESPSSIYPKPVSGRLGGMPKVTSIPSRASDEATATSAAKVAVSRIRWSAASMSSTASSPCRCWISIAAMASGAVLRPMGSSMIVPRWAVLVAGLEQVLAVRP
jgi:hypothetical protein